MLDTGCSILFDDEKGVRRSVNRAFEREPYQAYTAEKELPGLKNIYN